MNAEDIVTFWMDAGPKRWFTKDAAFDGELAERFGAAVKDAREGVYDGWSATTEGTLGLIILLDQVPRNIYRGSPLSFAGDARALALARDSIARGDHLKLPPDQAQWLIMPLEHSENTDDQRRCVALFQSLENSEMVKWAKLHLDIIEKFGRFPHRNAVLGRTSTDAEAAFLKAGGFSG